MSHIWLMEVDVYLTGNLPTNTSHITSECELANYWFAFFFYASQNCFTPESLNTTRMISLHMHLFS